LIPRIFCPPRLTRDLEYPILDFVPTQTLTAGTIPVIVKGKPFSSTTTTQTIFFKPNNLNTEKIFQDAFDEVEDYLLNRNGFPKYTAKFKYPDYDSNVKYIMINNINFFCVYCKTRKKFDKFVKVNRIKNKYIIDIKKIMDEEEVNFSSDKTYLKILVFNKIQQAMDKKKDIYYWRNLSVVANVD
jgi:hypothetical protein